MHRNVLQLASYHELRVKVELKSSDIREKLQELDEVQRVTRRQLNDEVEKQKSLKVKTEKLQIAKLQSHKNLLEIDRKIRFVNQIKLVRPI